MPGSVCTSNIFSLNQICIYQYVSTKLLKYVYFQTFDKTFVRLIHSLQCILLEFCRPSNSVQKARRYVQLINTAIRLTLAHLIISPLQTYNPLSKFRSCLI